MNYNLADVLTSQSFVGYVDKKVPDYEEKSILKSIFPDKKISGLDFSYIKTSNGVIELTAPSAYDAEPINQNREGFDAMKGELPLFRRKMVLSEKERQLLLTTIASNNVEGLKTVLENIYDDQMTLITGARATMEFLRTRALMDGKITMASKGGAVNFDYKVPATHKFTLTGNETWDKPEAPIITQIQEWLDTVEQDTGARPDTMIMNRNTFRLLRTNSEIRANAIPLSILAQKNVADSVFLADDIIMNAFKALTGLKEVIIYNGKVMMDKQVYDLIEDKKVVIFPSSVKMGNTLIGTSPAEFSATWSSDAGNEVSVTAEGIAVNAYVNNKAPYTAGTEVEFIAIPSFEGSDYVVQATVQE